MKKIFKKKINLNFTTVIFLVISQLSFASLTGAAKYLGPVITFVNDFRLELVIALSAIAALIIIWAIWENMADQNMPQMWKRIGMISIIYVVCLKVPDIITALGGAEIDLEILQSFVNSSGV